MSQAGPWGLARPRWSVATGTPSASLQPSTGIASRAGEARRRAWVSVGPPLGLSGLSIGSTFSMSPVAGAMPQPVSSPMML